MNYALLNARSNARNCHALSCINKFQCGNAVQNLTSLCYCEWQSVVKNYKQLKAGIGKRIKILLKQIMLPVDKKRTFWGDGEEIILLDLWAERANDLRRAKRNSHIFSEIAAQMGCKYSAKEVHVKIRNMTQKYRDEKKDVGPSGGSPSTWKHFEAVHRIIGHTAANSAETYESFSMNNSQTPTRSASPQLPSSAQPSGQLPAAQLPSAQSSSPQLPSPQLPSTQLSSPVTTPSPMMSPVGTSSTSTESSTPTSSSSRKRNYMGEVVKLAQEPNTLLKQAVEDGKVLTKELVTAIKEEGNTTKEFVAIMKTMLEKM